MKGSSLDDAGRELGLAERAGVERSASESLARQSAAGVYGHWVLAAVVLSTASVTRAHPLATGFAAIGIVLVGCGRLAVAHSFARVWGSNPARWTNLFRAGLLVSSATWGLGGSALLAASGFDHESRLVLLSPHRRHQRGRHRVDGGGPSCFCVSTSRSSWSPRWWPASSSCPARNDSSTASPSSSRRTRRSCGSRPGTRTPRSTARSSRRSCSSGRPSTPARRGKRVSTPIAPSPNFSRT